jgi:regulator of sigma E protease
MIELGQSLITILVFVIVLGGLVLVHEIGHFVMARLYRVRVLEFGIGFPPRAKVLRSGGETLYTLNWLPIGGFVKMEGEDGDDGDDPRSFANATLPRKLVILVAGVVMNLLLAFAIFTGVALWGEPAIGLRAGEVVPGSPAEQVGLQGGDVLVTIDGKAYSAFTSVFNPGEAIEDLQSKAGQTVVIGVEHPDGTREDVTVTLRVPTEQAPGALGIKDVTGVPIGTVRYAPGEAIAMGVQRTADAFAMILVGLADLGRSIITDPTVAPEGAAGPVGIAVQLGNILWSAGPLYVVFMAGLLSANLALVNILPFPPLDGGRMLMLLLKAIPRYGARISVRAERLTYAVGFVALFTFLIWITVFDIARQVGGAGTP